MSDRALDVGNERDACFGIDRQIVQKLLHTLHTQDDKLDAESNTDRSFCMSKIAMIFWTEIKKTPRTRYF